MFDSTVAPVRAEAKPLAVELYKYMGATLRASYENLRPAQQKEIDEAFAEAGKPQPSRQTRSAALKAAQAAAREADTPRYTFGPDAAQSSVHLPHLCLKPRTTSSVCVILCEHSACMFDTAPAVSCAAFYLHSSFRPPEHPMCCPVQVYLASDTSPDEDL